jgi:multicomponent Na+:H+ antiporter subunit D
MDSSIILIPLGVLITASVLCILFWQNIKVQVFITGSAFILYLLSAFTLLMKVYQDGIQVVQIGDWPAPFGITLLADLLASIMLLISAIVGFAIFLYSKQDISDERKRYGFYPVFLIMMFGVGGSFLTGDIFNLYVWFEVMLVASFVLIVLGNSKAQLEGAVKYVILSFISSGFLLTGIGILYKLTGTLNMADLAVAISEYPDKGLINIAAGFFFMGFGIKAAVFPLFFWLPASYPTPPISIAGLMAGLLTKVGVYALMRFFTLLFTHNIPVTHTFLLVISGLTMLVGVLGAVAQNDFRKILSFHIISQIGYMVMGVALFTPLSIAGSVFYIIHHILVKTNLYLVSGIVKEANGYFLLKKLGSVYDRFPWVSILFVISAFSLAGIPPLSGFWGKFMLAKAGLEMEQFSIVAMSLLVGLLTLFSMSKIWRSVFWKPVPEVLKNEIKYNEKSLFKSKYLMLLSAGLLTLFTLFLSLYPEVLISYSLKAAEQLLNPKGYIDAVLLK